MKILTPKSYWDANRYNSGIYGKKSLKNMLPKSMQEADIVRVVTPYIKPKQTMLEIGVAPGLAILAYAKQFGIEPWGLDYSENGVEQTKKNFALAGKKKTNVIQGDLFDKQLREKYKNTFDIVTSWGFIEHFDDPKEVVAMHTDFLKPGGLLIIGIPNIAGINRTLSKNIEELIYHDMMSLEGLKQTIPDNYELVELTYCGGLFNLGLFHSMNILLEIPRLACYIGQRLIADPAQRILSKTGIRFINKHTTPYIIAIAKKP